MRWSRKTARPKLSPMSSIISKRSKSMRYCSDFSPAQKQKKKWKASCSLCNFCSSEIETTSAVQSRPSMICSALLRSFCSGRETSPPVRPTSSSRFTSSLQTCKNSRRSPLRPCKPSRASFWTSTSLSATSAS